MVKYSGTVVRPDGVALPAGSYPVLSVGLVEAGTRSGQLVTTEPIVSELPTSGAFDVDLIPSQQILAKSGRPAVYSVWSEWFDPDGNEVPGGYSEWGIFYLGTAGGTLTQYKIAPPGVPVIEWVSTLAEAEALEPTLAGGSIIIVAGTSAWSIYEVRKLGGS